MLLQHIFGIRTGEQIYQHVAKLHTIQKAMMLYHADLGCNGMHMHELSCNKMLDLALDSLLLQDS